MILMLLLMLAGAAGAQTAEQTQGGLTVQAQGDWGPRTQARWNAEFEQDRQLLELHLNRDLGAELEAVLHVTHEWRAGLGTPGLGLDLASQGWKIAVSGRLDGSAQLQLLAPISAAWRAGISADNEGTTGLSLAGPRAAVRLAVKEGSLRGSLTTRGLSRGWFTLEGSADRWRAGYRYRVGELSVGARAQRTWSQEGPVDSLETDLLYRW